MTESQGETLELALSTLRLLGCSFLVRLPDGTERGDLVAQPVPDETVKRRGIYDYSATGVEELIPAMRVGETYDFPVPADIPLDCFQSKIRYVAQKAFGADNFVVRRIKKGTHVQCVRIR